METTQRSQSCGQKNREVNIGEVERAVSLVLGGALAVRALQRMDVANLALVAIGAGLILRGVTGHCGLYQALGMHCPSQPQDASARPSTGATSSRVDDDLVGEASLESFPASDPPAWTSATSMPMPARPPHVGQG